MSCCYVSGAVGGSFLQVSNDGGVTWANIECLTAFEPSMENAELECKVFGQAQTDYHYGDQSWSLSAEFQYDPTGAAQNMIRNAAFFKQKLRARFAIANVSGEYLWEGDWTITSVPMGTGSVGELIAHSAEGRFSNVSFSLIP
jgi:hypothetical protein